MKNLTRAIAIATTFLFATVATAQQRQSASVVSVGDGDTFRANRAGKIITIRLACVDKAEIAQQPFGGQARDRLRQLLPPGQQVQIRQVDRDRYGRIVAEVFKGGQSINLQLVREGHAVIYPQYFSSCSASRNQYNQAQTQARQRHLAFWRQPNSVMPWDFRAGNRPRPVQPTTKPAPSTTSQNCDRSYPDLCIPANSPDLDCGEISARNFRVLPPDPHGFDRDKDGIGCER